MSTTWAACAWGSAPQDSTTELSARAAVELLGLEDPGGTAGELQPGGRGAPGRPTAVWTPSMPLPGCRRSLTWLAQQEPCRLLPLHRRGACQHSGPESVLLCRLHPRRDLFGPDGGPNTFGAKCSPVRPGDAPDELVYQLTQTLYHGAEELAQSTPALAEMARPEFLYEDLPIPLHQGAADFYRAEGLIES